VNPDTDYAPSCEDHTPLACKPFRRLRVRHSYPESVIELVGHLRTRMRARDIAAALDIPRSCVYRWAPILNRDLNASSLISRCRADGFGVSQSIIDALASSPLHNRPMADTNSALPQKTWKERPNLETARSMMERNYFRHIDSNALADAAGLSRFRFIHAFSQTYNISPHQYLLRVRIEAAKKLLATSRETIDVIAAATGFRSGGCLNRAFTRVEGHCISRFCRVLDTRR
jgi:AraC-like DNA-binding protein